MSITNILTIDVEDYFQVENFKQAVKFSDWDNYELRVEANTDKILSMLEKAGARATFFVLGWIANKCPGIVKKIKAGGHEIASHGFAHGLIYQQTPDVFREDLLRSKQILEDIVQQPVIGYRAPTYSLTKDCRWALDILLEEGFQYDSSIFPLRRQRGGIVDAPRFINQHQLNGKALMEVPITTNRVLGQNISVAGGGYFRLFPLSLIRWSVKDVNNEGQPAVLYLHPWEFDPDQPRIKAGWASSFKHYVNLDSTQQKLETLLKDFRFTSVFDWLRKNKK